MDKLSDEVWKEIVVQYVKDNNPNDIPVKSYYETFRAAFDITHKEPSCAGILNVRIPIFTGYCQNERVDEYGNRVAYWEERRES